MKRYTVIADEIIIDHAFSKKKAEKIAWEYEYGCLQEDIPFCPEIKIVVEEIE